MAPISRAARLAALVLLIAAPALASHTIFSASVDRFEVDGNAFGPADGTPDQIDEFDNGTIAPEWSVLLGTAIEAGGFLTVKNPGVDVTLVPGVTLDISNVENTVDVVNGGGDFTATSWWVPTLPSTNTGFHFQLYGIGTDVEAAGLTVTNSDATVAAAQGGIAGYAINAEVTFLGGGGTPQHYAVPLDPAAVTGEIVLRMAFDDAADTLTCSFSLDGGATFQSPFPPLHVFQAVDEHEILLGANSVAANAPPPPPGGGGGCVGIRRPVVTVRKLSGVYGAQEMAIRGRLLFAPGVPTPFNPLAYGAVIVLESVPAGGSPLWALTVPTGPLGSGCISRDGWRLTGATYVYQNVSNALPPGCSYGSAQGLRSVVLRDSRSSRGEISFKARGKGTALPRPGSAVRAMVVLGQQAQSGNCAAASLFCRQGRDFVSCRAF